MIKYCTGLKALEIAAHYQKKKCGYCRSGKEVYREGSIAPKDFCVDAFYAAYPYFLALLYDAGGLGKEMVIRCPNEEAPQRIRISYKHKRLKPLLNFLEKIFRLIGYPKDAIDKTMRLETLDDNTQCKIEKGRVFSVSIPDIGQLCPASFFSFYPLAHLFSQGSKVQALSFVCPDPKTGISYDVHLAKGPSAMPHACAFSDIGCGIDLSKFKVLRAGAHQCREMATGDEVSLDKMLPQGICPFLFNIAIPYILTLNNGGYFKWSRDINSVRAQCPNMHTPVSIEVSRQVQDKKNISLAIVGVSGECPMRHEKGQVFTLDRPDSICLHLFTRIFPYIVLSSRSRDINTGIKAIKFCCPLERADAECIILKFPEDS